MAEPVLWDADGTPRSPRFDDIYRSRSGGWAQARHVFLQGCGLPDAWAAQAQWRTLETGFGLGLNFLATWHAWRADVRRPRVLHHVALEAWPVEAGALMRSVSETPELQPLARQLADQWWGLLPGWHRLSFEGGQVLLTLGIGDATALLAQQRRVQHAGSWRADSIFLDGFDPERNPQMWSDALIAEVAAFAHTYTRLATWTVARPVRERLMAAGFSVERVAGLAPKRQCLRAGRLPGSTPTVASRTGAAAPPRTVLVIGAGVAGTAAACSLARRGTEVTLIDLAGQPASGASSLPAGLFAPHVSPDDAPLSQITRAGVRATRQSLTHLRDAHGMSADAFSLAGVLEHASVRERRRPVGWKDAFEDAAQAWSRHATPDEIAMAGLAEAAPASWHACGGWVAPSAWVATQLQAWPVRLLGNSKIAQLECLAADASSATAPSVWRALDGHGHEVARADAVVLAAGPASLALLQALGLRHDALPLQALRGQVSCGPAPDRGGPWPRVAVNGHGSVIAGIGPLNGGWIVGSTFDRDRLDTTVDDAGHTANLERLCVLHPPLGAALAGQFLQGRVRGWAGLRATLADRLPAVGEVAPRQLPGLHLLTGLGARGLSLSVLCGELLAAHLHAEPLPLAPALAQMLRADRFGAAAAGGGTALTRNSRSTRRKPA